MKDDRENWFSHGFRKATSRFQAQSALSWGLVVVLVTMAGVLYLLRGSEIIVSGYEMQQMTDQLRELQEQNTLLEAQIAAAQSVSSLQNRAVEMGFVLAEPDDIEYLSVTDYPPAPESSESPPVRGARSAAGGTTWWPGLTRAFRGWQCHTAFSRNALPAGGS